MRYLVAMPAPLEVVSHYRLIERIGSGGMGEVWLAEDTQLPRRVVVKFLHAHLAADVRGTERLLHEARLAASVDHPNVVTILEAAVEDGRAYLVARYLEGETLEERLARGALPVAEAIALARTLADALAEVHAVGIVHRDLKPANVMLTAHGPRILDFGLSALHGSQAITAEDAIVGTPSAMSPEQYRGAAIDPRTDLWALGVILHHALAGRRPFDGERFDAVAWQVMHVEPEPPSRANPAVTPALDALVARLLAKEPGRRYRRAEDVLADLAAIESGQRPVTASGTSPARPRVAVLHFDALGPDADEVFLADGLTEDLIVDLARVAGIEVAARGEVLPYRGRELPTRTIARELGVAYVVHGSVRRAGARSRITAQLVNAADGGTLWAERYDRTLDDLFDVQAEVSRRIVEALQVTLAPEESDALRRPPTAHRDAYALYVRGQTLADQVRRASSAQAEAALREALALDPDFALAHATLAEVLARRVPLGWGPRALLAEAKRHAERALVLDPGLPRARAALGRVHHLEGDRVALLEDLRAARLLDAHEAEVANWIGRAYMSLGRFDDAIEVLERAMAQHPRSFDLLSAYIDALVAAGRREREAELLARGRELLIEHLERDPHDAHARGLLAIALAQSGEHAAGIAQIEQALAEPREDGRVFYNAACTYAYAGDHARALAALRELFAAHPDYPRGWMRRDPDLAPLHAYEEFASLIGEAAE